MPDPRGRFDPFDPVSMTAALLRALTDVEHAAALDHVPIPDFTWDLAANRLAGVYRSLVAGIDHRTTPVGAGRPLRLAVVAPLPPADDPYAIANLRLLQAVAASDGVDPVAFVPGVRPTGISGCPCESFHVSALPSAWAAGDVDAVVYVLGDRVTPALARIVQLVPGHVLAHDEVPSVLDDRILSRFVKRHTDAERCYGLDPDTTVIDWSEPDDAAAAATQLLDALH
jgi:hypothetical protein